MAVPTGRPLRRMGKVQELHVRGTYTCYFNLMVSPPERNCKLQPYNFAIIKQNVNFSSQ